MPILDALPDSDFMDSSPDFPEHPGGSPCTIVGGGPGGMMLALLLARQGLGVTLLEAHHDFDRDFRGDTIHPGTLEVLDQIGLANRLHELPHAKMREMKLVTPSGPRTLARFDRLPTRFPYVMVMPQAHFLEFLAEEARQYPNFQLRMGANVQALIEEQGVVRGVRYHDASGDGEARALLTVAADGRFSRLRKLAGLTPISQSPEIDIVWLRLPRQESDPHDEGEIHAGCGGFVVLLARPDQWQIGYAIQKGGYQTLRAAGLETLRQRLGLLVPWLGDRVEMLKDWKQVSVLSVESSRLARWHKPGLLLIGDAAHVMSPVGGLGINYAIGDAVEAANVLTAPLLAGHVDERELAEVQRRREWPVRVIQRFQRQMQHWLVDQALDASREFRLPLAPRVLTSLPVLRDLPARLVALGVRRVRLEQPRQTAVRG